MTTGTDTLKHAGIKQYSFQDVTECNMCGAPASESKVLGKRLDRRQGWWPKSKSGIATTVMKCRHCGLIFSNPMPIPFTLAQHYGVPPEEYWKPEYFSVHPDHLKYQVGRFEDLSGQQVKGGNLRALDVGTGIGKAMIALANAGFEVFGIEPSETFRSRAVERMGIRPEYLQLSSVEDASFAEGSFDFINLGAVLEHLFAPSAVLRKVVSWLKPGGLVYIDIPSSAWLMSRLARLFYRFTGCEYVTNISPMHPPYHLYEFAPRCFELNGQRNGYKVVQSRYWVADCYMPRLVKPLFHSMMNLTNTGMQLEIWLARVATLPTRASGSIVADDEAAGG